MTHEHIKAEEAARPVGCVIALLGILAGVLLISVVAGLWWVVCLIF